MKQKSVFLFSLFLLLTLRSFAQKTRQAEWQQHVNYKIDVRLDDQQHILRGFETMEYINNSPSVIEEIYIHIWPNAYKNNQTGFAKQQIVNGETDFYYSKEEDKGYIDSLDFFINGKGTSWSFDPAQIDIVKILLNKPLKTGESCTISTPFLVKIPKVFSRLGHDKQTYNITQWYPKPAVFDVNGWNPIPYLNQGEFYSEFGSFDVNITLPKNYIIAATGVLLTKVEEEFRNDKGKNTGVIENTYIKTPNKTVHFFQDSIHDFAWFASKNFGIMKSNIVVQGKNIETFVYSQKEKDFTEENMEAIKTALVYYSNNAGLYPYSHATVVKSELKAGGGMEYPMITVCDILNREVIIHEVGHNWFYGILGSNERRYPWMDESINSFFEAESMKPTEAAKTKNAKKQSFLLNLNDYSMELMAINAMRTNQAQAVGLHSAEYTNLNYGTMVYGKGALIFKHLQAYLGEEMLKKCFNAYYEAFKFKHPLPDDMQTVFENVSGKKLDWFFQTLVQGNDKIDYKIRASKSKNNSITLTAKKSSLGLPFPIGIYSGKTKIGTRWIEKEPITITGDSVKTISKFEIDPEMAIMDIDRKNNQVNTKGLFKTWTNPGIKLFTRPDNKPNRELYVLPMLGYNIHNGFLAGVAFHNWGFPQRKLEYMLAPMWGFKTNTINGYANVSYKITPKKLFQSVDLGVNNASFAYKPYSETYTYYRTKGYVNFNLKPKTLRSSRRNKIQLAYTNVASRWLEKYSETVQPNALSIQEINYRFGKISFSHSNTREIDPYSVGLSLEGGGYTNTDSLYLKPGLEFNFFKSYNKKKKGFSIRAFCGTFYSKTGFDNGLFMYRLGSKNGAFDYGMDQTLMGRGAESGLWSRNITPGEDNMKILGTMGNFTKPFLSLNVNSTLPGKIPFRPYLDLCFNNNDLFNESLIYTAGICLPLIPEIFIVYFPLTQSKYITDTQAQKGNDITNFKQRICFTLVLNEFEPHKLFKRIKLF